MQYTLRNLHLEPTPTMNDVFANINLETSKPDVITALSIFRKAVTEASAKGCYNFNALTEALQNITELIYTTRVLNFQYEVGAALPGLEKYTLLTCSLRFALFASIRYSNMTTMSAEELQQLCLALRTGFLPTKSRLNHSSSESTSFVELMFFSPLKLTGVLPLYAGTRAEISTLTRFFSDLSAQVLMHLDTTAAARSSRFGNATTVGTQFRNASLEDTESILILSCFRVLESLYSPERFFYFLKLRTQSHLSTLVDTDKTDSTEFIGVSTARTSEEYAHYLASAVTQDYYNRERIEEIDFFVSGYAESIIEAFEYTLTTKEYLSKNLYNLTLGVCILLINLGYTTSERLVMSASEAPVFDALLDCTSQILAQPGTLKRAASYTNIYVSKSTPPLAFTDVLRQLKPTALNSALIHVLKIVKSRLQISDASNLCDSFFTLLSILSYRNDYRKPINSSFLKAFKLQFSELGHVCLKHLEQSTTASAFTNIKL